MAMAGITIIGGGSGGISVAAKIRHLNADIPIRIIEPSRNHYYQPLWTLVGAGIVDKQITERPTESLIPKNVELIRDSVVRVAPETREIVLKDSGKINYDYLIFASGLKLDWHKIEGLGDGLGTAGTCSIYEYKQSDRVFETINAFTGGVAIFVMPPMPIKCAGAPQKIMYLAEEIWRKKGIRDRCKVMFVSATPSIFGIPLFADALKKIVKERDIETKFGHKIKGVDLNSKSAFFEVKGDDGKLETVSLRYDMIHIVPPMSAPEFVSESSLAFQDGPHTGWLAVDQFTLQHKIYDNIFGIGDVTGIPNSKTGAAIRKQYPVVAANILSAINGEKPSQFYDGYSSCPLVTQKGKVMLAEFGYDGKIMPTFPLDPSKPRRSYWYLKKDFLPQMYWHGMLKGRM